jgi:hypothetical protein
MGTVEVTNSSTTYGVTIEDKYYVAIYDTDFNIDYTNIEILYEGEPVLEEYLVNKITKIIDEFLDAC